MSGTIDRIDAMFENLRQNTFEAIDKSAKNAKEFDELRQFTEVIQKSINGLKTQQASAHHTNQQAMGMDE